MKMLSEEHRLILLEPDGGPFDGLPDDDPSFEACEELRADQRLMELNLGEVEEDGVIYTRCRYVNTEWGHKALRVDAIIRGAA